MLEQALANASKFTGVQTGDLKIVQNACEEELEKRIVLLTEIMDVVKAGPPTFLPADFYRHAVAALQDLKRRKQDLGPMFVRYADEIFKSTEIARKTKPVQAS